MGDQGSRPADSRAFDYDDISLIPRQTSTLAHRAEADASVRFGPLELRAPLLASPMPDVCGAEMAAALAREGALGILHRFNTIQEQVSELCRAAGSISRRPESIGAGLGVTGDYRQRFRALYDAGCRVLCVDTANGANEQIGTALEWLKQQANDIFIIAGNIGSAQAFEWLEAQGADAIRVGIAGGSVCETRTETGVFVPTPYAVAEACSVRRRALIIGDGGVRTPADMCKLLALGADLVMLGSALAGTEEAPGRVLVVDEKKYKIMRGAASFSVQRQSGRPDPQYIEGTETLVPYRGRVEQVLQRFLDGLRSSMSYMNARSLAEYRSRSAFIYR